MAPHDMWDLNPIYQPGFWLYYIELFTQLEIDMFANDEISDATDEELEEMDYLSDDDVVVM